MLSRVADAIYWMRRYIERAENIARFIDVNLHLMLDMPSGVEEQWDPLVHVTGDYDLFLDRYGTVTREHVIEFLTFDPSYPNSIASCLFKARENARSVREIISSEMWEQINAMHLFIRETTSSKAMESPHSFYTRIKMGSHLFSGITDATMSHGEGWHFGRMGGMLERADKTSRILDVKYFILLPALQDVGTPFDHIGWGALLKSASAFEMYRKTYGPIAPAHVASFLILNREFPRAIHFCLDGANRSMHSVTGVPVDSFSNPAEHLLGRMCSQLDFIDIKEIMKQGLHEYLDDLQSQINAIDQRIFDTFIALKPAG